MRIRNAGLEDAETVARFNVLLAKESEGEELEYRTVLKGVRTLLLDERKGFYLVALEKGEIVGQVMVTYEWSDWRNRNIWWIQSVYVTKPWRRRGVFRDLFEELWVRAAKEGVGLLRLYVHGANRRALEVYRRLGMEKTPYSVHQMGL
ncbi:MAG: GNAT family N-acetyltransferase [Euryarchaeota archaeon]|nr:GNAT family N-acetyltransferase [Euryarchaeota archaeon]